MQHVDSHYDIATIGTNYQHHSMHFQPNPEHDSTTNATTAAPSTTSVLRSWRKKDASEKQSNNPTVSEQTTNTPSESQGPVARVAPHNHYPKPPPPPPPPTAPVVPPTGDIYRYQQQYGDFSVQNPPQLPPPVKYSEIIEPMQSIEPIPPIHLPKTKEKTYMEMCSVQQNHMKPYHHQEYPNYKQHYDGIKNYNHGFTQPQYHHPPHPYLPKESQPFPMQKEPTQYLHNYKMPSNYPRNYPRDTGNEFLANLNKIAPDMAQDIINDPHLRDPQYPMYSTGIDQNRIYHPQQHHHQRIYQRTSPIQQNYPQRNIPQNFNQYQMNQQRIPHGDHYRMYPPPHQRYSQVEQIPTNISPRQYHENIMGFPPRISPNYPPCNQIEYPQHYQPTRQIPTVRQDYLPMPGSKPYNIEAHPEIPEIVPEDSLQQPKKTLKAFLENWREEFTEEAEGGDPANPDKVQVVKSAGGGPNRESTLYVLDAMEIPSEKIPQYLHLQSIEKLPPNIRGFAYNSNEEAKQNAIVISANLKSEEAAKPDLPPPKDESSTYQLFQTKDDKPQDSIYHPFHEDRPACKLLQSMANARNASLNEKPMEKHDFALIAKEKPNYEETQKSICRSLPELITEDGGDLNRNQDNLESEYSKIVDSILEENANNEILAEKPEEAKILEKQPQNLDKSERKSVIVAEIAPKLVEEPEVPGEEAIQDLSNLEDPIDLSHHFEPLEEIKDETKQEKIAETIETNQNEDEDDDFNTEETKHVYTDILSFKEVLNLTSSKKEEAQENQEEIAKEDDTDSADSISSKASNRSDEDQEGQLEEVDDQQKEDERIVELSIPDGDDQILDDDELMGLEPGDESKSDQPDSGLIEEDKLEEDKLEDDKLEEDKLEEEIPTVIKEEDPDKIPESPKKIEEIKDASQEGVQTNSLKQEDELGSSFVLEIAKELLQINVSEDVNGEKIISVTPLTKVRVVTAQKEAAEPIEDDQNIVAKSNEENSKIIDTEIKELVKENEAELVEEIREETDTEFVEPIEDIQIEPIEEARTETAEPIEIEIAPSIEETQIGLIEETKIEIAVSKEETQAIVKPSVEPQAEVLEPIEETQTDSIEPIEVTEPDFVEPIEETQTDFIESIEETQTDSIEPIEGTEPDFVEPIEETQTDSFEPIEETKTDFIEPIEETQTDFIEPIEETQTDFGEPIEETQTDSVEAIEGTEPDFVGLIKETKTEIVEPIEESQTAPINQTEEEIITTTIEEPQIGIIAPPEETQPNNTAPIEETESKIIASIEETPSEVTEPIVETETEILVPIEETQIADPLEENGKKKQDLEEEVTIISTGNVIPEDVNLHQEELIPQEDVITETDLYLDNEVIIGDKLETSEVEIPLDNHQTDPGLLGGGIKEGIVVRDVIINNNYIKDVSCVGLMNEEEIRLIQKKNKNKLKRSKTKNSVGSKSEKHKKYLKNSTKKKRRVKFDLSALKRSDPLANLAEKTKIFSSVVVIDKLPIDSVGKLASDTTKNNPKITKTPISNVEFKKLKNKYKIANEKKNHLNQLNSNKNSTKIDKTTQDNLNQNKISNLTSPDRKILPTKSILKKPTIPEVPKTIIIPEKILQTPKSILKKTWDYQTPPEIKPSNPVQINPVTSPDTKQFPIPKGILKKSPTQFVDYPNYNSAISKFKDLKRNKLDKRFQLNYLENYTKRRLSLEEYNNRKKKAQLNEDNLKKPDSPKPVNVIKDDKEEAMVEEVLRSLNNDVMGFEEAAPKSEAIVKAEQDQIKNVTASPPVIVDQITPTPPNDDPDPDSKPPTTSEEPQISNNDLLKTPQIIDKSTIEEKLNSLEEFLPKIAPKETPSPRNCDYNNISKKLEEILSENPIFSSQKFSESALMRRFLNDDILTGEELKRISQIVQYKKAMRSLQKQSSIDASPRRRHSSEFAKSIKIDFSDFDLRRDPNPNESQNQTKDDKSNSGGRVCYNRSISAFVEEESKRNSSGKSKNRNDCLDWASEISAKTPENPVRIKPILSAPKIEYLDEDNDNCVTMKLTGIQTLEVPKSEAHNGEIKTESFAVTNKHSILNIMAGSSNQSSTIKHAIENIIKIDTSISNSETNKRIELGQSFKEAQAGSEQVPNLDANSGDNPIKLELEESARQNPQMKSMGIQRNDPEVVENLKKSFDKSKMIKSIMVSAQNLSAPSSGGTESKTKDLNDAECSKSARTKKDQESKSNHNQNETKHSKSVSKTKAQLKSFQDIPDTTNSNPTKTQETKEHQPASPVISNITKLTALLTYYKKGIESGADNVNLKKIEEIIQRLSPNLKNLPNLPEVTAPNEYEVTKDDKLKLHIKKKQQNDNKKRKKRFRNLYTENESDEDPNGPKTKEPKLEGKIDDLTDYSVYQRKNLAGVPKLVLKRRKSDVRNCPLQPCVKISRVETIESMVKRKKKSILLNQIGG